MASLYLDTTGVTEEAAEQIRLRWKGLRSQLDDDATRREPMNNRHLRQAKTT